MLKKHLPSAASVRSGQAGRGKGGAPSRCVDLWIADGRAAGWSNRTLTTRSSMLEKFQWWLAQEAHSTRIEEITSETIRFFLAYLRTPADGPRWEAERPNTARPAGPSTVDTYYRCLRAFFNFLIGEGLLSESPVARVSAPKVPKDQVVPFTQEQVQALLDVPTPAANLRLSEPEGTSACST